jgi:hypothetical protein
MKKTILAGVIVLSCLCAYSWTSGKAKENSSDEKETGSGIKNGTKRNANALANDTTEPDQYEGIYGNNSFASATIITPVGDDQPSDFTFPIYATICNGTDEDYYELDLYGDAIVTAALTNISTNCDYDLYMYSFDNNAINPTFESDVHSVTSSTLIGSSDENIAENVKPGAFYFEVAPKNDRDYDDTNQYKLTISVTYNKCSAQSVSNLRYNKGDIGALWVSDYDPFGLDPLGSIGGRDVGYTEVSECVYGPGVSGTETDKYDNPFSKHLAKKAQDDKDEDIVYMVAYIWDGDTRNDLSDLLFHISDKLSAVADQEKKQIIQMEETIDVVNASFELVNIAISVGTAGIDDDYSSIMWTPAGYVSEILNVEIDQFIKAMIPYRQYTRAVDLEAYTSDLAGALEYDKTDSSDHEVIRAITSYHISDSLVTVDYVIGYTSTDTFSVDFFLGNLDGFLFSDDTISAYQLVYNNDSTMKVQSYINGKIYVLHDAKDVCDLINSGKFDTGSSDPDIIYKGVSSVTLEGSSPGYLGNLDTGEYYWYSFVAADNAYFTFKTSGNTDTYGELFSSAVPGRSIACRFAHADDGGSGNNFSIQYAFAKGSTVYIRVRGSNWTATGPFAFGMYKGDHFHVYTDHYLTYSTAQHKAYCCCGGYVLQPHVVDSSKYVIRSGHKYATCLDCGASVDLGTTVVVAG